MKVILVNAYYQLGSTGNIVADVHDYLLEKGVNSLVCYAISDKKYENNAHLDRLPMSGRFSEAIKFRLVNITGLQFNVAYLNTFYLIRKIKKFKPDLVHIHLFNERYINPYILLSFLANHNIKTIVSNHADILFTANCDHAINCDKWISGCHDCYFRHKAWRSNLYDNVTVSWKQMLKAFRKFGKLWVTSVSPYEDKRAKLSPFFKHADFTTILNGINTDFFQYIEGSPKPQLFQSETRKIVLHVTSGFYHSMKGGRYVLEIANKMPDCLFVVIGISDKAVKSTLPANVISIGRVTSKEALSSYYRHSDITLLTSLRESFSLTCAESLCCGTPVAGFYAGGPESIGIPEYMDFMEQGHVDELISMIRIRIGSTIDRQFLSKIAVKKFSKQTMCKDYMDLYNKIL